MAEEDPGPRGFTDVVAIGQSFMRGQDATALVWLRPDRGQPVADRQWVARPTRGDEVEPGA
jgi:hypothetical protein